MPIDISGLEEEEQFLLGVSLTQIADLGDGQWGFYDRKTDYQADKRLIEQFTKTAKRNLPVPPKSENNYDVEDLKDELVRVFKAFKNQDYNGVESIAKTISIEERHITKKSEAYEMGVKYAEEHAIFTNDYCRWPHDKPFEMEMLYKYYFPKYFPLKKDQEFIQSLTLTASYIDHTNFIPIARYLSTIFARSKIQISELTFKFAEKPPQNNSSPIEITIKNLKLKMEISIQAFLRLACLIYSTEKYNGIKANARKDRMLAVETITKEIDLVEIFSTKNSFSELTKLFQKPWLDYFYTDNKKKGRQYTTYTTTKLKLNSRKFKSFWRDILKEYPLLPQTKGGKTPKIPDHFFSEFMK